MSLVSSKKLSAFLNVFMVVLLVITIIVLIVLPWITKEYMKLIYPPVIFSQFHYYAFLIIMYFSGFLAAIILNALRKIFNTCKLDNPFIYDNVKNLKIISFACILISLAFIANIFMINSLMTLIVIFVFMLASLFALVLAEVFEKAVDYKVENDYTI